MVADRTYLRGLGACYDMATVPALPDLDATLLKYLMGLHVLQQRAVSLLVGLLNSSYTAELLRQLLKFLFLGLFRHALVRIRPLGILALCRVKQVLRGIPQLTQLLEPELRMLLSFYFKINLREPIC